MLVQHTMFPTVRRQFFSIVHMVVVLVVPFLVSLWGTFMNSFSRRMLEVTFLLSMSLATMLIQFVVLQHTFLPYQ